MLLQPSRERLGLQDNKQRGVEMPTPQDVAKSRVFERLNKPADERSAKALEHIADSMECIRVQLMAIERAIIQKK